MKTIDGRLSLPVNRFLVLLLSRLDPHLPPTEGPAEVEDPVHPKRSEAESKDSGKKGHGQRSL